MSRFWFQPSETEIAHRISELSLVLLCVIAAIMVIVFGIMAWSIWRHRLSVGHAPATFTQNTFFEVLWSVIPILIVVGMAFPATSTVFFMKDTSSADLVIKVTGYQWKWKYDYLKEGVSFYSQLSTPRAQVENREAKGENYLLEVDNPLVVPVGRKVRIITTANDVIHSWWVPAFGVKQDAIPGFVRDTWFKADHPGTYRGQCVELCGKDHGFMPVVVTVLPADEYEAWISGKIAAAHPAAAPAAEAAASLTLDQLKSDGAKVYAAKCVGCHQSKGQGLPPAFPALARGQIATGPLAGAIDIVLNGSKRNPAMTAWKDQLGDTDIAAVVTYFRNDFGNAAGDMVQPAQVAAARH
jgi:cytochrome c oxidase subunit 2